MRIGPKYKICKRLGSFVFQKCQTPTSQLAEARAPRRTGRGRRGGSDFGAPSLEKQKARFTYGLSENQFARYAQEAMEGRGSAAAGLLARLESRLDNIIYRAGFVKTRRAARQVVGHGHVLVNGKRLNIPSYQVQLDDVVSIRPESRASPLFANRAETVAEAQTPAWMTLEQEGFAARIATLPTVEETATPFSVATIIQFYSR